MASNLRPIAPLLGLALVAVSLPLSACDKGDQLGGVERAARAAFNGWDMWETSAVRPYENPMPQPPAGAVPTTGRMNYTRAAARADERSRGHEEASAAAAYRSYCHHCHGINGDGRIIVGESLNPAPRDLRSPMVQRQDEAALFDSVAYGTPYMIPLARNIDPVAIVLAIRHIKERLGGAPSRPYFTPKYTRPLE